MQARQPGDAESPLLNARLVRSLDRWEAEPGWREPSAFLLRADAMDELDLALPGVAEPRLHRRALALVEAMEARDRQLFATLRERVRAGDGEAALAPWLGIQAPSGQHYDALDVLLAGVLALREPASVGPLPAEAVFYQPTPARHLVDGIRRAGVTASDTLLDIGAGLGHVPLLAHILTGARCLGVEREAAYVEVATDAARELCLHGVEFAAGDARDADFSAVDVFYLFTPMIGVALREVIGKIEHEAASRPVRVVSLGPCTRTFARLPWLHAADDVPISPDRAAVFRTA